MQSLPDIALKCHAIISDDKPDKDYRLMCLSVDDPSIFELSYVPKPSKPSGVVEFESMDVNKQKEFLKNFTDFWTNPGSPAGKYLESLRTWKDKSHAHRTQLVEMSVAFAERGDLERQAKVDRMIDMWPSDKTKDVEPEGEGFLASALKEFGGKVVDLGKPIIKRSDFDD